MPAVPPSFSPLPAADGIRGLACLIVLIVHSIGFHWPRMSPMLFGGGKYGVWLFFVLSAFLLTFRLQQRGFTAVSLLDYALGRILRILPLFALACLLYYWAGMGIQDTDQLHAALTFEQGFIHLWTIPVEFKFYLLLPPLAWAGLCLKRRLGNAAILLAGIALLVLQQSVWPYWQTPENSADTRWYLPSFLFGILAALLLPYLRSLPRIRLATPFALFTLLILLLALPGSRLWLFNTPLSDDLLDKHLYLGLMWACFTGLLLEGHGLAGRLLCSRPLAFLGIVSYSTYLFHWLILMTLAGHWPGHMATFLIGIFLSIVAGAAGHYLAERPLENLRKRLMAQIRKPRYLQQ